METVIKSKRVNWLYFLGNKSNKDELFLYGLSLPTSFSDCRNSKPKQIYKDRNKQIYLFYSIKDIDINAIQDQEKIIFNRINSHINCELSYFGTKQIIQVSNECNTDIPESPIGSTVTTDIFHSDDFYNYKNGKYLDDDSIFELQDILKALQEDTGQSFAGAYSKRLGCFEYGHVKDWSEDLSPFKIHTDKKQPNKYYFSRTIDNEDMFVHLVVYSRSDEILLDEFKLVQQGIKKIEFSKALKGDGGCEYWVFNRNGDLLHRDKFHWLLGIGTTFNILGSTTMIDDKYSRKDPDAKKVTIFTPSAASEISYSKDKAYDSIYSRENIMHNLVKKFNSDKQNIKGKWFSRSDNAISDIMSYINKLTSNLNSELLIIDPFISKESLSPLLRLENATIQINIISCWGAQDPDTCETATIYETKESTLESLIKIKAYELPASGLIWHVLKESLFHDRFIVIKNKGERKVFMLSNSINNLLKKYDFCIALLDGLIGAKCLAYIDTLVSACSEENRIYPEVTSVK